MMRADGPAISCTRAATRAARSAGAGLLLLDFLELAIADELLETVLEQPLDGRLLHLAPAFLQRLLQALHHRLVIAVRPARRLADDAVDQAQRLQPCRRDAQRLGRLGGIVRALPQDRGAAFG